MWQEVISIDEIGRLIGGKYCLVEKVGQGGFSEVFRAADLRLGKVWAVKRLERHSAQGLHEANLMKQLDYPTLPRIVDLILEENRVYLVMDYLEGESLGGLLRGGYRFSEEEVLNIGCELAGTLRYLHGRTPLILYRDMKPDNLMRNSEGQLKLVDFGIASCLSEGMKDIRGNAGTRGFAAPEQYGGICDERTDIYGLGMTLRALSAGKGSRALKRLIKRCTRKNKARRFASAAKVEKRLKALLEERRQNRSLRKWILGAMGVLLASGGIYMIVSETEEFRYSRFLTEAACAETVEDRIAYYGKAIDIFPERGEAYLLLLQLCSEEQRTREGAALVEQKLSLNVPGETVKKVSEKLALLYFCGNPLDEKFPVDYGKAAGFIKSLAEMDSVTGNEKLWQEAGEIAGELGKFGSKVDWERVCRSLQHLEGLAERLEANGEPLSGYQMFLICGSVYITNAAYLNNIVEKPYRQGISLYEEARIVCRRAALGKTCERDVDERLSSACYLSGMLEETGEEKKYILQKSIEYGHELFGIGVMPALERNVRLREAAARRQMGDAEGAVKCYEEYLELYPEDLNGICSYAALLLEEQRVAEAAELIRNAKGIPGAEKDRNYQILQERLETSNEI